MFEVGEYIRRGYTFLHNKMRPHKKILSSLMIYTTDMCDSACKHCLIWAKRPVTHLTFDTIRNIMESRCVTKSTTVGLEGGEFLLHPEADQIMEWFRVHHPKYDLFSNCLKPDKLIASVKKYKPHRLYISLDGDKETYKYMRGKDGFDNVVKVIDALKDTLPVFVMFTLSPYNDMGDLEYVAELCRSKGVFLRVGIYDNISFFDTIDDARVAEFGQKKDKEKLTFSAVSEMKKAAAAFSDEWNENRKSYQQSIPPAIKAFEENYDYIYLYDNWVRGKLRLKCHSILDSIIILPDGTVPICQHKDLKLGNIYDDSLDVIFNSESTIQQQQFHSENCNQCWISYHRKYDVVLYRNFEKYFGKWAASKMLGYYKWDDEINSYKNALK